ncbi:hypothetical protein MCBMB27_02642 [Methylobacterium phyllosphaerae]|uniref:DUF4376 domain-containing protein n=1 Tax=Methylobacterium phyllosphaerae TaxID=418223 RepID=A0AAE8HSH7_9HYPH|nr:DUF4376 domain-containing protein [Methylobacterium phyllosphaerae]APT31933.1 hypothetical protein MCBMB27_02642 [Methylobacterium phyllosphaerae]SFH01312.1 protein of unknown function [Methylobacterium phyllosphaerae]
MQLFCKPAGDGLIVLAVHADGDTTPLAAYPGATVVLPYAGEVRPADMLGKAPPAIDLSAYAAAKRFAVETGGIVVAGAPVATDRGSQAMIANALSYVQASGAASVSYKSPAGFVTLTAEQIKAVGLAVGAHVQACFQAEDSVDAGLHASPPTITTFAQVDAAFAGLGA